jgi:hypothetical protein
MRTFRLALLAILLMPSLAHTEINDQGQFMVLGIGPASCGTWTKDRRQKRATTVFRGNGGPRSAIVFWRARVRLTP